MKKNEGPREATHVRKILLGNEKRKKERGALETADRTRIDELQGHPGSAGAKQRKKDEGQVCAVLHYRLRGDYRS